MAGPPAGVGLSKTRARACTRSSRERFLTWLVPSGARALSVLTRTDPSRTATTVPHVRLSARWRSPCRPCMTTRAPVGNMPAVFGVCAVERVATLAGPNAWIGAFMVAITGAVNGAIISAPSSFAMLHGLSALVPPCSASMRTTTAVSCVRGGGGSGGRQRRGTAPAEPRRQQQWALCHPVGRSAL